MPERSVAEALEELSTSIPWDRAADWDVSGLTLGDPDQPVRSVGVCHEVTDRVVAAIQEDPVDLLFTYHPLLFRPVRTLRAGRGPEGLSFSLVKMGVALAVAHTAFDVCSGGAADALAASLDLRQTSRFGPMETSAQVKAVTFLPAENVEQVAQALASAGAGQIGNYRGCSYRSEGTGAFSPGGGADPVVGVVDEENRIAEVRLEMIAPAARRDAVVAALIRAHPYEEPAFDLYPVSANLPTVGRTGILPAPVTGLQFVDQVADVLGVSAVRGVGSERQAASEGGGGARLGRIVFWFRLRRPGAEMLVTGDVSHHQMSQAEQLGMAVIDPGHVATEAPGLQRLLEVVTEVAARTIDLTGLRPGPEFIVRR